MCSDCRTLIYQQSDDVVAVRYGRLEISLNGASGVWKFHCKEPVGFSAWTGIILDLEPGIGFKN